VVEPVPLGLGVGEHGDVPVIEADLLDVDLPAAVDASYPRLDLTLVGRPRTGVKLVSEGQQIPAELLVQTLGVRRGTAGRPA
jgi:hypothetical protein